MACKKLVIDRCDQCPDFSNQYYSYRETCVRLDRVIPGENISQHPIPDDCPLEDNEPKEERHDG